jgi:hypothetical protein
MVNCHKIMETKIANIEVVSNLNELKDKIIQVDKLLDEIKNFSITFLIDPVESSQEVHH